MEIKLLGLLWDVVQRKPLQLTPVFERLATETSKLIDVELVRMAKYYNYSSSRKSKVVLSIILEESVHGIASTSSIWFTERVCASGASLILTHGPLMSNHQNNKKNKGDNRLSPLWSTLTPHCLQFVLKFSPSALPLQPHKASDSRGNWSENRQLHAWHESISSGRQGKSLTQFEESPRMAVSKDKETVTKQILCWQLICQTFGWFTFHISCTSRRCRNIHQDLPRLPSTFLSSSSYWDLRTGKNLSQNILCLSWYKKISQTIHKVINNTVPWITTWISFRLMSFHITFSKHIRELNTYVTIGGLLRHQNVVRDHPL